MIEIVTKTLMQKVHIVFFIMPGITNHNLKKIKKTVVTFQCFPDFIYLAEKTHFIAFQMYLKHLATTLDILTPVVIQEALVHAPKLWAEKISKRALIIVSIIKR